MFSGSSGALPALLLLVLGATAPTHSADLPAWKNVSLTPEQRVEDLLGRLSDAELIGQLSNTEAAFLDQPVYEFGQECLAGFQASFWGSQTVGVKQGFPTSTFPHAVSLGMSFDAALVRSVAAAIGHEARAAHTHYDRPCLTCSSPVLNVARDPRWGRCMEAYGEDPTNIAKLGTAYVTGIQHGDVGSPQTDVLLTAASPKHFADYNLECTCRKDEANCTEPQDGCHTRGDGIGRNAYDAQVSAHDMRETYLAGWRAVGADAQGVSTQAIRQLLVICRFL